jgi:hypothetical protein
MAGWDRSEGGGGFARSQSADKVAKERTTPEIACTRAEIGVF